MENRNLNQLELRMQQLDQSMAKMADTLADFMQKQAAHDERSLNILESMRLQRDELTRLRDDVVAPLVEKVNSNKFLIAIVAISSGGAGGLATKIIGL